MEQPEDLLEIALGAADLAVAEIFHLHDRDSRLASEALDEVGLARADRTADQVTHRHRPEIALPPDDFNALVRSVADKVAAASEKGTYAGIVTTALRRRFLRTVLNARGVMNPVLSFEEIGADAKPALVGLATP